ncbi:MAG TPA: hypothetical protein VFS94_11215 [Gemmatimonadales bacterium]|nr:hypothetical protein [Gemmatimonadales bacterium]
MSGAGHVGWVGVAVVLAIASSVVACSTAEGDGAVEQRIAVSRSDYEAVPELKLVGQQVICDAAVTPECAVESHDHVVDLHDGRLLVHAQDQAIAIVDSSGSVVERFGGPGEGPGEYRMVPGMGATPGGDVWLFDLATRRKQVFAASPDSGVRSIPLDLPQDLASLHGSGDLLVMHLVPLGSDADELVTSRFVATDLDGAEAELASMPSHAQLHSAYDLAPVPGYFQASPVWDFNARGDIVFSEGREYELQVLRKGQPPLRIEVGVQPRLVQEEDLQQEIARATTRGGLAAQLAGERAERAASHFPALSAVVALDDRLFAIATDLGNRADSVRWDILDAQDGHITGHVRLESGEAVVAGDAESLVILRATESGVQRLARVGVERSDQSSSP